MIRAYYIEVVQEGGRCLELKMAMLEVSSIFSVNITRHISYSVNVWKSGLNIFQNLIHVGPYGCCILELVQNPAFSCLV